MAKTINIANIKIGLNIDELKTSGQFARHELSMLARTAKSAESPFQKLASAQSVLDRAFEEGGMSIESYNTMLDVLAQKFNIAGAYAELAAKRKERFDASTEGKVAAQRIADEKRLQDMISKGVTDRQKMAEAVRFLDRQYEAGETDVLGYNMALEGLEKQFGLTSIYAKNAARDEAELNKERRRAKAEADAETAAVQRLINSGLSPMAHHLKNIDLIKKQLASKSITDQEAKTAIEGSAKATGVYADRMKDISRLQGLIASSSPYSQVRSDVALLNAALDKGKINADQYAKAIMKIEQGLGHSIGGKGVASRFEKSFAGRMQTAAIGVSEQGQWNLAKRGLLGKATPEDIAAAFKSKSRQTATSPQMLEKTGVAAASTAKQLAGLATAYIGVSSAMNLVKGSVKLAAEIETVGMSFQVLTKSTATSNQLMKEMRELSKSTAVPFVEHARGAKMLLGVGVASDQVKQSLYQLSAISMGNTDTFQGLVKALADVNAAGRLTGQEMLQFRNAGFNPLNEIARTTGKSMAQLKVDMEEGRIPLEMLTQAISSYTTGSGRAAGMNEKIMQTTQGVFTQFQNTMQETMIVIGQELTPAIAALIPIMQEAFSPSNAGVFLTILTKMTEGFGAIIATVEGRLFQYLDQLDKRKAEMESRRSAALTQATKQVNERGITEQRLTAQQEEWHQNEIKRIQKEREAHREKTMSILEDNAKARAANPYDPDAFERQKMREDTFGKTRAEQLQTEFDIITMSETRRINELNDIRQKQKASEDSLVIEQRLMQLRKDNPLISDDKLKDYASIEQVFQRQVAEEKQMLQARINLIKGDGGTAAQIQAAIKREEELSKNRVDGLRRTLDSALATTFKEARQELQASARALTEKWNPEQGLKQQLAQLEFMRQQNMIGSDTFQKAALDIGKQVMEARGFLPNIAPTLKAGTAEAYKYILEQNAKSEERAQMQKLTQDMLKELQQANQFNAQAPRLALTR